jgi:hypothetical protein
MTEPIVITFYGKGPVAEYVTICRFEDNKTAENYMRLTEDLDREDDSWTRCEYAEQWRKYDMTKPRKVNFNLAIPKLDDRAIQKVLREVDSQELAKALKGTTDAVQEKIFANMSKRAGEMMKEDMEFMGPVREAEVKEVQKRIVNIIQRLVAAGEIIDPLAMDIVE